MIVAIEDPEFGSFGFVRSPPHLSAAPELPANPAPSRCRDGARLVNAG